MMTRLLAASTLLLLAGCPRTPDDSGDETEETEDETDDTEDTGDTEVELTSCYDGPSLSAWAGNIDPTLVSGTAYTNTGTGITEVLAAATATIDGTNPQTVSLTVTGATVVQTGFNPSGTPQDAEANVWVASGDGILYLRLPTTGAVVTDPGDQVTFTVTKVGNFFGELQIQEVSGWTVTSSDNPVYVKESTGTDVSLADQYWTHHIYGQLSVDPGEATYPDPPGCGGSSYCFDFLHSTDGGTTVKTTLFRIANGNLSVPLVNGDCVEIYSPMVEFDDAPQFNIADFSWQRWYGNVEN